MVMANTPIITDELELTGQQAEAILVAWVRTKYPQYATALVKVDGILKTVKITAEFTDTKEQT